MNIDQIKNSDAKQPGGRKSLTESVTREILNAILIDRLQPGAVLQSEMQLSERLGISRGIVREAVRGLVNLGIVEIGNGRRPRVGHMDGRVLALLTDYAVQTEQVTIQQTLDVRRAIEVRAAQLAALQRSQKDVQRIRDNAEALKSSIGDVDQMTQCDIAFHISVATASRNPFLRLQVESFRYVIERTGPVGWHSRQSEDEVARQIGIHAEIADAIADQDANRAAGLMSDHFTETVAVLSRAGYN